MARQVLTFYKLANIDDNIPILRSNIRDFFKNYNVLGRVYIGPDGLNAQISIDDINLDAFKANFCQKFPLFGTAFFNHSTANGEGAFDSLRVKVRPQILSDGIGLGTLNTNLQSNSLAPLEFHRALLRHMDSQDNSILLDIRNGYELELGRFPKTTIIRADTFKGYMTKLPAGIQKYDPTRTNILMVCTGGIRCSKAGIVLRNWGWNNVNMLQGGITNYVRELETKILFSGVNFTFDGRHGERIDERKRASRCSSCGELCDLVTNCANSSCNRMIIQCEKCDAAWKGTCGPGCRQIIEDASLANVYRQIGSISTKRHREQAA